MKKAIISLIVFLVYSMPFTYLIVDQDSGFSLLFTILIVFVQVSIMTYFAMFTVKKTVPIMMAGYTVSILITAYLLYGLNVGVGAGMESYFEPLSPVQSVWVLYVFHIILQTQVVRLAKKHINKQEMKQSNGEEVIQTIV
ncbi:hypothetical protein bcgnr5378_05980 [Bacillus cereus]|uniref:Uncharacterized protein n=1 Tax=Bacillus cereus TaxID=1396 RepID=A0A164LBA5_BACCE|nr:hypothetical protein [Bacillus cereus]KZD55629.1 hypothetical protein B4088_5374 [Bacillus cereus]